MLNVCYTVFVALLQHTKIYIMQQHTAQQHVLAIAILMQHAIVKYTKYTQHYIRTQQHNSSKANNALIVYTEHITYMQIALQQFILSKNCIQLHVAITMHSNVLIDLYCTKVLNYLTNNNLVHNTSST